MYVAERANNVIRKITVSTGIISTVAGTGNYNGYSGDGGAATSAKLNYPCDVKLDSSGNLFIADQQNNCIRKVTVSTGIISTIIGNSASGYSGDGGAATTATLNGPKGVAVDSSGTNNHIIFYIFPLDFVIFVALQVTCLLLIQAITVSVRPHL